MTGNTQVSKKRMLWEMINPLVFFIVCMFLCTLIVQLIYTNIALQSGDLIGIYRSSAASALAAGIVYYAVTIIVKRKTVIYDKFKYGHESKHLPVPMLILYTAASVGAALLFDFLINISGLPRIFTGYDNAAAMTMSGQHPVIIILSVAVLGPIAEEIIFRWLTFGRMRYYLGKVPAIIISSLLFGAFHGNMIQFIYCTGVGIVFAYIYDRTGNIYVTITAHMIINFIGIIPVLMM